MSPRAEDDSTGRRRERNPKRTSRPCWLCNGSLHNQRRGRAPQDRPARAPGPPTFGAVGDVVLDPARAKPLSRSEGRFGPDPMRDVRVHAWSRRWLADQWQEWQPRTRASATEALARFITIAVEHAAKPPEGLRVYLYTALSPTPKAAAMHSTRNGWRRTAFHSANSIENASPTSIESSALSSTDRSSRRTPRIGSGSSLAPRCNRRSRGVR